MEGVLFFFGVVVGDASRWFKAGREVRTDYGGSARLITHPLLGQSCYLQYWIAISGFTLSDSDSILNLCLSLRLNKNGRLGRPLYIGFTTTYVHSFQAHSETPRK
ncbi:uncharacterized protein BO95DRAFT_251359 [Aspergillus brunneoviolaceus CBS 621.78]|uniref:Uncharacterized protein n=1 Tax=Aspergillus brunneoviolaceus CBS 621.78 TaxID=1450534 RepID=A0ACD1FYK7_9EURO|nr:hypothetical protein BO95DRAFT_251359 [Aspergillus brunneoviolaceus CBS 621.78]RAH42065.1 hypothetical protein BO95DRAFT_251359 [Aspergillus brunneoviolaceus CBS 621.78]